MNNNHRRGAFSHRCKLTVTSVKLRHDFFFLEAINFQLTRWKKINFLPSHFSASEVTTKHHQHRRRAGNEIQLGVFCCHDARNNSKFDRRQQNNFIISFRRNKNSHLFVVLCLDRGQDLEYAKNNSLSRSALINETDENEDKSWWYKAKAKKASFMIRRAENFMFSFVSLLYEAT